MIEWIGTVLVIVCSVNIITKLQTIQNVMNRGPFGGEAFDRDLFRAKDQFVAALFSLFSVFIGMVLWKELNDSSPEKAEGFAVLSFMASVIFLSGSWMIGTKFWMRRPAKKPNIDAALSALIKNLTGQKVPIPNEDFSMGFRRGLAEGREMALTIHGNGRDSIHVSIHQVDKEPGKVSGTEE